MMFKGKWDLFWNWYVYQSKRFAKLISFFYLLFISLAVYYSFDLPLENDLSKLLPEKTQSVQDFNRLKSYLGGVGFYISIIESTTSDKENLKLMAAKLAKKIHANTFLNDNTIDVYYKIPINFFKKYALLYAELGDLKKIYKRLERKIEYEVRKSNPYFLNIEDKAVRFYMGDIIRKYRKKNIHYEVFMNAQFQRVAVFIKPSKPATDVKFNEKYFRELQKVTHEVFSGTKYKSYLAGRYVSEPEQNRIIRNDIAKTSGLTILILFIVMMMFFRSVRAILLIGLPLLVAVIWTFALTGMIMGRISLISAFLGSILFGLGVDYGIHLLSRYKEERLKGNGVSQALVLTFTGIFSSIGYGAFTTSVAFLVIGLSSFEVFGEFGKMAFVGILCCIFCFVLFFPAFVFISESFFNDSLPVSRVSKGNVKYTRIWFAVIIIFSFISIFEFDNIEFEYDIGKLTAKSSIIEQGKQKLASIIERADTPIVYDVSSLDNLKKLDIAFRVQFPSFIGSVQSVLQLLPDKQEEKLDYIFRIDMLLKKAKYLMDTSSHQYKSLIRSRKFTGIRNFSVTTLPENMRRLLVQKDDLGVAHFFYYIYPPEDYNSSRGIIDFAAKYRKVCIDIEQLAHDSYCKEKNVIRGISDSIILDDILKLILEDAYLGFWIVLIIVSFVLLIIIRNARGFIAVFLPLVLGLILTAGFMILGNSLTNHIYFKLNYINLVALPLLVGVGIDNGLHLYKRMLEKPNEDISRVLLETGNAVLISNLTTCVGFASLLFSSHVGLASLGALTSIGIICIFFVNLITFSVLYKHKKT